MNKWFNRLQYLAGVFASATIVVGVVWNYMIRPTLASEFATIETLRMIESRFMSECADLAEEDAKIIEKIDKVSDKIDIIYQILIK